MKLYMFRTVSLSIIRSFSLYTQQWYVSYRFADSLRTGTWSLFFSLGYVRDFLLIFLHWFPLNLVIFKVDVTFLG